MSTQEVADQASAEVDAAAAFAAFNEEWTRKSASLDAVLKVEDGSDYSCEFNVDGDGRIWAVKLVGGFKVGDRYETEMSLTAAIGEPPRLFTFWSPGDIPIGLNAEELADHRAGHIALLRWAATLLGMRAKTEVFEG